MRLFFIYTILFSAIIYIVSFYSLKSYKNELDFRYISYGNTDLETVVVIPGLDGAVAFFSDVIPELTPRFHVLVFHIPLFTKEMNVSDYNFIYLANELNKVLNELGINKVSIVGESFGGVIAQHYAHKFPERMNKLIVLSSLGKFSFYN